MGFQIAFYQTDSLGFYRQYSMIRFVYGKRVICHIVMFLVMTRQMLTTDS